MKTKKWAKIISTMLTMAMLLSVVPSAFAEGEVTAKYTESKVLVNGTEIAFEAYNINGNNYFKLRDIAKAVSGTPAQFNIVGWSGNAITFIPGDPYEDVGGELVPGDGQDKIATFHNIFLASVGPYEGECEAQAYLINDNNYFQLRFLGDLFRFKVDWDAATNTVIIDSTGM